jgi:nucleotide-binding universal stress UspA family protein
MAVLVPYDGSEPAQRAVEHAVREMSDEPIVLLRVIEAADGSLEAGLDLIKEAIKERRKEGAAALSEELSELIEEADVEFEIETAVGKPAREIVAFAEANDISHVVIGSHGRKGATRVLLGSVAQTVVRRAPMTVTVVR